MTDDHEPQDDPIDEIDELDELLSAHLDAELELLEDRPDLDDEIVATRLRELRGVADAVGASVPPLPPSVVDDQIATALAALPTPADAPTSLTAARAAKRRPSRLADRLPALGAVAAVVLVLVGLGVVVANIDGGADSDADAESAEEPVDFRQFDDDSGDSAETEALEAAPAAEATEAPAEAAADSELADAGGDEAEESGAEESDTTEATDDTEAPETTVPADESTVPIELPQVCTDDLLSRLDADELVSAFERLDRTAEITVLQGGAELTVIIDPGLCNGSVDPILTDQP